MRPRRNNAISQSDYENPKFSYRVSLEREIKYFVILPRPFVVERAMEGKDIQDSIEIGNIHHDFTEPFAVEIYLALSE